MSNYTVRIEGNEKVRTITCPDCTQTFDVRRRMPARGKWPTRCTECASDRHRTQKRELQRKVRSGNHTPTYAASRPLWNRSDHEGPGSRTAIGNDRAQNLTRAQMNDDTYEEADAVDALQVELSGKGGHVSTAEPRRAPVYTGDEETDQIKRALIEQNSDTSFFTGGGANVGCTSPDIPFPKLDDEAREWLRNNPEWWKEEATEDGGWGCRPNEFSDPDRLEEEELRYILGIELEDDDDELMRQVAREREEYINRLLKHAA